MKVDAWSIAIGHDGQVGVPTQGNGQNEDQEPVPDATINTNFEFGFEYPWQVENLQIEMTDEHRDRNYETTTNDSFEGHALPFSS